MSGTKNSKELDLLFSENTADVTKQQSYKENIKTYELPEKYFLLEMYNKQKELQTFLAERGRTQSFPDNLAQTTQPSVQLAIYHLFCAQVEFEELKIELRKLQEDKDKSSIDAQFELIDMFFFIFNVGIYTGLDMNKVVDDVDSRCKELGHCESPHYTDWSTIDQAIVKLMNYLDKLPWKAWKQYDYSKYASAEFDSSEIIECYASAIYYLIYWASIKFGLDDRALFNLYMNKWEENRRRQIDIDSGYNIVDQAKLQESINS